MDQEISFDFGEHGGAHRFRSYGELLDWAVARRDEWRWLEKTRNFGDVQSHVLGAFTNLVGQIERTRQDGVPLKRWQDDLNAFIAPGGTAVLASSTIGHLTQEIREAYGDDAGVSAIALLKGWTELGSLRKLEHLQGAVAAALPWAVGPQDLADRLQRERGNMRQAVRRLIVDTERAEDRRNLSVQTAVGGARQRTVAWVRSRFLAWNHERRRQAAEHAAAIEELHKTTAAYNEFMHLQAPVEYWAKKAGAHQQAEKEAFGRLILFFPLALVLLAVIFGITAWQLLQPSPDRDTSVYFVVSAGLATIAGLIFWIGRLLTRLYLSEHHLRKDAEEREIMTRTYLALTRDDAADEKDRHIVLSALFRNASDGIVKDDAGDGALLSSLLSRFGMTR